MSLLRFVDPTSGKIFIDGLDITKIGVYDLRSRVTFIPQGAVSRPTTMYHTDVCRCHLVLWYAAGESGSIQ